MKDGQGREEIKRVQPRTPRRFDSEPLFTSERVPPQGAKPEALRIKTRPDLADFKEPYRVTLRNQPEDTPATLLVLHPDGRVEFGEPLDARALWVAMQGDNTAATLVAVCLSETARLRREIEKLKKDKKRSSRKKS